MSEPVHQPQQTFVARGLTAFANVLNSEGFYDSCVLHWVEGGYDETEVKEASEYRVQRAPEIVREKVEKQQAKEEARGDIPGSMNMPIAWRRRRIL